MGLNKIVIAGELFLSDQDRSCLNDAKTLRTDIASILEHIKEILSADLVILLDEGALFDVPETDGKIRDLLGLLSLTTKKDREAITSRFPAPFEEEPLLNPSGYAVKLLAYDFEQRLISRKHEWLGTKESQDPVLQRKRLTEAVATAVCRCFSGGKGDVEQHVWVFTRDGSRPFRSDVLDLLFGKNRKARWPKKGEATRGPIAGLCHALSCTGTSGLFMHPPDINGMLIRHLGRPKIKPLRASTGNVVGMHAIAGKLNLVWIDITNQAQAKESILSTCLSQFGITWPRRELGSTFPDHHFKLALTAERKRIRFHRVGWVVKCASAGVDRHVIMGHKAFLLLLAHIVSAMHDEPGIDPMAPRINQVNIERCYKKRDEKAVAKPAQQIHLPFRAEHFEQVIIQPSDRIGGMTRRITYRLSVPLHNVDIDSLRGCDDPDVCFLMKLMPE